MRCGQGDLLPGVVDGGLVAEDVPQPIAGQQHELVGVLRTVRDTCSLCQEDTVRQHLFDTCSTLDTALQIEKRAAATKQVSRSRGHPSQPSQPATGRGTAAAIGAVRLAAASRRRRRTCIVSIRRSGVANSPGSFALALGS